MSRQKFVCALARTFWRVGQPGASLFLRGETVGGAWSLRVVLEQLTSRERAALPALWRREVERRIAAGGAS